MSRFHSRLVVTCLLGLAVLLSVYIGETKFAAYSKIKPNHKLASSNFSTEISTTPTSSSTTSSNQNNEQLTCEKVWYNLLLSRRKQYNSKLNPNHFVINDYLEIVSENTNICDTTDKSSSQKRLLLVLVSSSRTNFRQREIIRESWGSIQKYKGGWEVRTVFLLGQSDYCLNGEGEEKIIKKGSEKWNEALEEDIKLQDEHLKYRDLLIGSFTDSYRNNTYRHLMGYKFVLERCPQAEFIIKTDDDVFVNIPRIIERRTEETKKGNKEKPDMYCKTMEKREPVRCKKCERGKWFVTGEEWPTDQYPFFCLGAFFGITREWVEMLFAVKNWGGFFWIDDPFISGKLREIAEKEFGVKAKWVDVTDDIWWLVKKGTCKNVKKSNIRLKQKKLPLFAHLQRNEKLGMFVNCLTDISMGRNLPFSL